MLYLHSSVVIMKHKGSISQNYLERDRRIIPDLVRQAKGIVSYPTDQAAIFKVAATLPVKMFYIADDSAIEYVRGCRKGRRKSFKNPYKQQLYDSLYHEVEKMLEFSRYREMRLRDVVIIAMNNTAPCIGLAPSGIRKIYIRLKSAKRKSCTDSGLHF